MMKQANIVLNKITTSEGGITIAFSIFLPWHVFISFVSHILHSTIADVNYLYSPGTVVDNVLFHIRQKAKIALKRCKKA